MTNAFWTDFVPSDRDILITKVQHGEMTPQEAEREATRHGLEPLEVSPNPSDFDPMSEALWTLPMAHAWIMWRTPDAVREMWDLYREKFRFWFFERWEVPGGPTYEGHFLARKKPAEHLDMIMLGEQNIYPNMLRMDYLEACQAVCNEAQRAKWRASGISTEGGARREIQPFEWADFCICGIKDDSGVSRAVLRDRQRGALRIGYNNVLVPVPGFQASFSAPGGLNRSKQGSPYDGVLKARRGLFLKVEAVVKDAFPSGIPELHSASEIIRVIECKLTDKKHFGTRPSDKTLRNHIKTMRGNSDC